MPGWRRRCYYVTSPRSNIRGNDHDEPRLGANNFREPWLDRQFKLSAEVGSYSLLASTGSVVDRAF
jgi:hypothetical protein